MECVMSRQQRRKMARQLAKSGNVQESVRNIERRAHAVADNAIKKIENGAVKQAKEDMQGQMFVLFLAWAHIKQGFGAKRLTDMARSLNMFCNDMSMEETKVDDLYDVVESETGLNLSDLFKTLNDEENERMAKRRKEIKQAEEVMQSD